MPDSADSSPTSPLLPRVREAKIDELSRHFANDDLSLEDLERRIERVYKAGSLAELESITADLQGLSVPVPSAQTRPARVSSAPVSAGSGSDHGRILAIMSETRRTGRWTVPRRLEVVSVMSDTKLDLTQAILPAGVIDVEVRAVWAACKITIPPGVRVINETHAIMAAVRTKGDDLEAVAANPSMPTIRLRGLALMAEVKVVVRRRERTAIEDDD